MQVRYEKPVLTIGFEACDLQEGTLESLRAVIDEHGVDPEDVLSAPGPLATLVIETGEDVDEEYVEDFLLNKDAMEGRGHI